MDNMSLSDMEKTAYNRAVIHPMRRFAVSNETVKVISTVTSRGAKRFQRFSYYINGNRTTRKAVESFMAT